MLIERNLEVVKEMKPLRDQLKGQKLTQEEYNKKASEIKGNKNAPVVMIKSTDDATYKNMVDILDEMQICNIGRYALVDITDYDKQLVANLTNPVASSNQ